MQNVRRNALVTGGSRGIGRAICLALHKKGFAVAVHYSRDASAADGVVAEIVRDGGRAIAVQADFSQAGAADRLVAAVLDKLGSVSVLVNNAAIMTDATIEAMTDAQWDETLRVNLTAVFECTRTCLPGMKSDRWGRIINISSQAAYTGSHSHSHYAATKAAIHGFTYSLTKEVAATGITANIIVPGRIETDMLQPHLASRLIEWQNQTPMQRLGTPEEVAAAVAFLASDEASYITGAAIHINGGLVMG